MLNLVGTVGKTFRPDRFQPMNPLDGFDATTVACSSVDPPSRVDLPELPLMTLPKTRVEPSTERIADKQTWSCLRPVIPLVLNETFRCRSR